MLFGEFLLSVSLGWILCMVSTWLFLLRFAPYVDSRMLPRPKVASVGQGQQQGPSWKSGTVPEASIPSQPLQETEPIQ